MEEILITAKNRQKRKVVSGSSPSLLSVIDFFVQAVGAVSLFSVAVWILTGSPARSETSDKLTYIAAGIGVLLFGLVALKKSIPLGIQKFLTYSAYLSILVGIAIVEHKAMSQEHPMGFGWGVFVLTLVLLPLVYYVVNYQKLNRIVVVFLWIPAVFVVFCDALAFWQTRTTLIESAHSEYVINEILSPTAGYNSYQSFVPQYTFLLGWLVKPILTSMSVVNGVSFLVLLLTAFGFACLGLMVWVSRKAWPELPLPLLLWAVLAFCTPTPGWNRLSFIGPASTLLSGPALRVFGGMIVGFISVTIGMKLLKNSIHKWQILLPGIACAFVVWNNLDFGLAATVASFIVIATAGALSVKSKLAFLWHILGQILGHTFIFIYLSTQGGVPNWSLFGWFARQFGGGFGSVTIEMPGPVNLDFPLIMGTAATGFFFLLKYFNSSEDVVKNDRNSYSAITAFYFGAFCTFALPYYVNRSYHSGQMSILYIPLSVALIAAIGLVRRNLSSMNRTGKSGLSANFPTLILSFMLASVLLIPNPNMEIDRITGGNPNGTIPRPPVVDAINTIPAARELAAKQNLKLAYFGEEGNYVRLLTGIDSVNIFNSPLDMFQSDASVKLSCSHLLDSKVQLLVLTESARQSFAWNDGSLCDGHFVQENIAGVGIVGVRKK